MARKGEAGDIVSIGFDIGRYTFGVLLTEPYVAVYDVPRPDAAPPADLLDKPVLFILAVHDRALGKDWPVVGKVPPGGTLPTVPEYFMQDMFNPQSCKIIDAHGNARPATIDECAGLERAAVWEAVHVTERIRDHYAERPNAHLQTMKLRT